jgi:hypothetical protein
MTQKTGDLATIEAILRDPAASFWLKAALLSGLSRDPVDAANDAACTGAIVGAPMPQYSEGHHLSSSPRDTCPENRTAFPYFCHYRSNNRKCQCTSRRG